MEIKKQTSAGTLLPMEVTKGVTVNVLPNEQHEYLMTTKEVANGYGVNKNSIFQAFHNHNDEMLENKHFILGVNKILTPIEKGVIQPNSILFTKRGIVRLGFFIKSERAKLFRDWAEDLIIKVDEYAARQGSLFIKEPARALPPKKRLINRLDRNRMVRLLAITSRIEDSELRNSLVNELIGGFDYETTNSRAQM
ncbi:MAG: ORF6N domain-containing protein [Prevotellaceae bacterium]|jgi:hypothetical protein|nr:ORF6N domain-containing protein [Prevotellaceae bacterium]